MKSIKNITRLLVLALLAMVVFSCKKDLSTFDTNKIAGIEVDTTNMSTLSVFQFDHLIVNPVIKDNGASEDNFTYEWKMNFDPRDTAFAIIGNEKNLDYEVRLKPNEGGYTHILVFTATDKSNGLKYIMPWKLTVKNSIGEGLVIAHSTDGQTTDISHIMSPLVTPDFNTESVKQNVYSAINNSTIPGIVKQMRFTNVSSTNNLFAITDNSIVKIKTLDYTFGGQNDDLFYGHTGEYKPSALSGVQQNDLYIENGQITATWLALNAKFGLPIDQPYKAPAQTAVNAIPFVDVATNFYDEENEVFVYLPSFNSFGDRNMHPHVAATGKAFNPVTVKNKVNLAAGAGVDMDFLHILKDKTTGKIELYVFDAGGYDYDNYVVISPAPKAYYDLSNAPGINNATQFVLLDDQRVLYYTSGNKIYAVLYSASMPVFDERYEVPVGEQITTLQIYRQSDYPWGETYLPTNNKQLIMSTYGTEGKVYIMPLINIGVGNIDKTKVKTYGGFGRVSAITTQK